MGKFLIEFRPESIGSPGISKNVLTVGATHSEGSYFGQLDKSNNIDYIAYFSSIGPTFDGRIKPDIVAPGAAIKSAKSENSDRLHCNLVEKDGT